MAILLRPFHRKRQTRAAQPIHQIASTALIEERRHHINVPYVLPKDDCEVRWLNFQQDACRAVLGADYTAPLDPQIMKMLGIGSSTGCWVIEMARQLPQFHVMEMDLEAPVLHTSISPNCQFQQNDILSSLPFPEQSFAFVHQRLLVGPAIYSYLNVIITHCTIKRTAHSGNTIQYDESKREERFYGNR